jgi:uncharacterized membrane protein YfcA
VTTGTVALAGSVGLLAGGLAGLTGVGGGILFVPALVLVLGQGHLAAEATSLLAILPVALMGALRQRRYGNVRLRDAAVIALISPVGVVAGVVLANALPERALRVGFALLLVATAARLARSDRGRAGSPVSPPRPVGDLD